MIEFYTYCEAAHKVTGEVCKLPHWHEGMHRNENPAHWREWSNDDCVRIR